MLAKTALPPVGSLIVFDSEDRAEVEAFLAADPFSKADLYASALDLPLAQGVLRRAPGREHGGLP